MEALSIRVYGRVQGVFFRASARDRARQLRLTGWVRNVPDGSVELWAEGPRDGLGLLLAWCREGPSAARVDRLDHEWTSATGDSTAFAVRH